MQALKVLQAKRRTRIDMDSLEEVNSSDSEPEDFCTCKDECSTTLCYSLPIKQVCCTAQCKCMEESCRNRTGAQSSSMQSQLNSFV